MGDNTLGVLSGFAKLMKRINDYNEAVNLLLWDMRTGAPVKGISQRSSVIGMLSTEAFRMTVSDEMSAYLTYLTQPDILASLDEISRGCVKEYKREFERFMKIPEERYKAYIQLTAEAESIWEKAKHNNDFELFKPYLEQVVAFQIEFTDYWGYTGNRYNTLLDYYEPGMTVEKLDTIFNTLKEKTIDLLNRIEKSGHNVENSFLGKCYDIDKQKTVSMKLLQKMGYDFEAGRLDISEHPFTSQINAGDVRLTTHYHPEMLASAIFSTLHEGGHGLYEQNIDPKLAATPLGTGTSSGIHESQSRLWENFVGRNRSFWLDNYRDLMVQFPEQLNDISKEAFYRAVNKAERTLIRVEADELTYNLHIMIRYEIEKALINKELEVRDLPEAWNRKVKDYLGIEPPNDTLGVLQDVHWSNGLFGYFPTYALGNIYAAQFYNALKKAVPDLDQRIRNGELVTIKQWLSEKIYQYGKLKTPEQLLLEVTGETINASHLAAYLEEKYSDIYGLNG